MLRISWQTLRAHRGTLAGAFIAIWLAVTLAYGTGLLMAGALGPPGPGRFAAADAVITGPRLDATRVDRAANVAGVERAVSDVSFPVGAWDAHGVRLSADPLHGHGWASTALAPHALTAGRAPAGAREVAVDERAGLRPGARVRVATPAGEATYRVSGTVRGPAALFFADRVAARLSGAPGRVNAIAVWGTASPHALGRRRPRPRSRGGGRRRRPARRRPGDADRDLRDHGRDRGRGGAVRRRRHVHAGDHAAPARGGGAARARRRAASGPAPDRRRGADRVGRGRRSRPARRAPARRRDRQRPRRPRHRPGGVRSGPLVDPARRGVRRRGPDRSTGGLRRGPPCRAHAPRRGAA